MSNVAIHYSKDKGLFFNETQFALFPLVAIVGFTLLTYLLSNNNTLTNHSVLLSTTIAFWYIQRLKRKGDEAFEMIQVVTIWLISVFVNSASRELVAISDFFPESMPMWATMAVGIITIITQYNTWNNEIFSVFKSASWLMWADIVILNTFYVAWIWESHGRFISSINHEVMLIIVIWVLYAVVFLTYAPLVWMVRRTEGTLIMAIGGECIKIAVLLSLIADLKLHTGYSFSMFLVLGTWACVIGAQVARDSAKRRIVIGPQPDSIAVVLVVSIAWALVVPTVPKDIANLSLRSVMGVDTFNWSFMLITFAFVTIRLLNMRLNTRNYMSELTKLVLTDSITNTANRYALSQTPIETAHWLLMTDFDGFKAVNELRGSSAGDALLRRYCDRLKATLNESVGIFRLSNDEFAIMAPKADYSSKEVCEIVLAAGKDDVISEVGVSIGVTSIDPGEQINEALAEAFTALSHAKTMGRNRWVYLQRHLARQREREIDLQRSIVGWRGNLYLKYFPVMNSVLPDADVVMLEAVPVWDDPEIGKVDPMDMWLEAERVGRAADLANWVITDWLRHARAWSDSGYPRPVSVYLPLAVIRDPEFMENLQSRLSDAGDLAQWLIINVSEDVFGYVNDSIVQSLTKLRETGLRIGINDFGIGPAMVGEIAYTPIDVVRVAPELLSNLNESTSMAVVRVLINLSRDVGMNIILAGVSNHHLHSLQELGSTLVTGPIAGKALIDAELYKINQPPLPARDFKMTTTAR